MPTPGLPTGSGTARSLKLVNRTRKNKPPSRTIANSLRIFQEKLNKHKPPSRTIANSLRIFQEKLNKHKPSHIIVKSTRPGSAGGGKTLKKRRSRRA
jgi:hypothetical protein